MSQVRRITLSAASFSAVVVLYLVYWLCLVPLIEPAMAEESRSPRRDDSDYPEPSERYGDVLRELFPVGAWQLDKPNIIETSNALFLIKSYEIRENGQLHVEPLTIVVNPPIKSTTEPRKQRRAFVIESSKGATLRFDQPLDFSQGKIGKITGGVLAGNVRIWSRETEQGENDAILIQTEDVHLDRRRLETTSEVSVQYGDSIVRGNHLIVELAGEDSPTTAKSENASSRMLSALKHIELVSVTSMRLAFDIPNPGANKYSTNDAAAPIQVLCKGSFRLDVPNQHAELESNSKEPIHVRRDHIDGKTDHLRCRRLSLFFSRQPPALLSANATAPEKPFKRGVVVDRLSAIGGPVDVYLAHQDLQLECNSLEYDFTQQQFRIRAEPMFKLQWSGRRMEAKSLSYRLVEDSQIGEGEVVGPGWFQGALDGRATDLIEIAWGDAISVKPEQELHRLEVRGGIRFQSRRWGRLTTDHLDGWLDEVRSTGAAVENSHALPANSKTQIQMKRLVAHGNVHLDSRPFMADTGQLDVDFQIAEPQHVTIDRRTAATSTGPSAQDTGDRSRFHVTGRSVRLQVVQSGRRFDFSEIQVQGKAHLRRLASGRPHEKLDLLANEFFVKKNTSGMLSAIVSGQPSKVQMGRAELLGDQIHFDQSSERAWIPGPGRVSIPIQLGNSEATTAELTWKNSLDFDGRVIRLRDAIRVRTSMQNLQASQASITLATPLDWRRLGRSQGELQVQSVKASGGVELTNDSFSEFGLRKSRAVMQVGQLELEPPTGDFRAMGPGQFHLHLRGNAIGQLASNRSADSRSSGLTYLGLRYESGMDGNFHRRRVNLRDGVRAVTGPVANWTQSLSMDAPNQLRPDIVYVDCQQLILAKSTQGSLTEAPFYIEALNRTFIRTSEYSARAHRLTYSQAKDLLTLEGDGRTDAELIQRRDGRESRGTARKFLFSPGRETVIVQDGSSIEASGLPN